MSAFQSIELIIQRSGCVLSTGLHISFHKSTFMPIVVDKDGAMGLAAIMGCPVSSFPQTNLGLPLSTHKVERAILGWRTSHLSKAGRLTLAESVLMVQDIYTMSVLPFPQNALDKIDRPRKGLF